MQTLAASDPRQNAAALLDGERDPIANAANLAALIGTTIPDLNWAGVYLLRGGELVVGPFHGKPACVRIALGKGVCGTAAQRRETIVVPDVHAFPGHIACDPASRSEIVVPLLDGDHLIGVLDIDSPLPNRFGEAERALFEDLAALLVRASDWGDLKPG
jgi:L-methionine (R)-S-oxide reductase